MPRVQVKFEGEATREQQMELVASLTNAVASVLGDEARKYTWVIIQEVRPHPMESVRDVLDEQMRGPKLARGA